MNQPMKSFPDFTYTFLAGGSTLCVNYHGEIPTRVENGEEIEDAGLVDWPSDEAISAEVGKTVQFRDSGDCLTEALFTVVDETTQPTQKILAIVSERLAAGLGDRDETDTLDTYTGTVVVDGVAYDVQCAWPDGAEAHELNRIVLTCEPVVGDLWDSETNEYLREATQAEVAESLSSGPEGHIRVDFDGVSRRCYVLPEVD